MSNTFSCGQCGKRYPWRASIAGKKAKCTCGQILAVPQSPPAEQDDGGLYDIAGSTPVPAAQPIAASRPSLAYAVQEKKHSSSDSMVHAPRDIYVPTGLLLAGFLAIFAWGIVEVSLPMRAMAIISLAAGVATAIKTAVLIGIAIVAAPMLGISFGTLRTAILKFAAIIIFTDAALLWLDVIMKAAGAMPVHGRAVRGTGLVMLMSAGVIITLLTHYLFDMDWDETAEIALPMAVLSRLIGFIMTIVLIKILVGMTAPATPAVAPAGGPNPGVSAPGGGVVGAGGPVTPINETAADRALKARIARADPRMREAREHIRLQWRVNQKHRELVDTTYAGGARTIYFEVPLDAKLESGKAYIELPAETAARATCFAAVQAVCQAYAFSADDLSDKGQQFVTVDLKQ